MKYDKYNVNATPSTVQPIVFNVCTWDDEKGKQITKIPLLSNIEACLEQDAGNLNLWIYFQIAKKETQSAISNFGICNLCHDEILQKRQKIQN